MSADIVLALLLGGVVGHALSPLPVRLHIAWLKTRLWLDRRESVRLRERMASLGIDILLHRK